MDDNQNPQPNQPQQPDTTPSERPPTVPSTGTSQPVSSGQNNEWQTPATTSLGQSRTDIPTVPPATTPPKKRKGLLVGGIIAAALVILGGGGASAYFFWYQNPDKVVTDSIINLIKAKTVTYTGLYETTGDTKLKIELTGKNDTFATDFNAKVTFPLSGKDYTVEADAIFDTKADLYLKLKSPNELIELYKADFPADAQTVVDGLVAKVNDKWIKISAKDMASVDEDTAKKQECATEAVKKYYQDDAAMKEVGEVYKKNKFIKIIKQLGGKDGSLGYELTGDENARKAFLKEIKNTKVYKTLTECDPNLDIKEEEKTESTTKKEESTEYHVEVWVDRWKHELTSIKATTKEKDTQNGSTAVLNPVFNQPITLRTPENAVELKDIQEDIQMLMMVLMMSQMTMDPELAPPTEIEMSSDL